MEPFIFFSYGLTKSGSTLAFQLAVVALQQAGFPQPRLEVPGLVVSPKINAIEHVSDAQAAALADTVRALGHPVALKTHTRPDPAVRALVATGAARAHAVVRDPRDIALSMLDHGARARARGRPAFSEIATLEDAIAGIDDQMRTLAGWLALPGVRVLRFDRLAFETTAAAAAILDQLGVPGDPCAIAREVLGGRFTQFNTGRRDRHLHEMAQADSARLRARYDPFFTHVLRGPGRLPPAGRLTAAPDPHPAS